MQASTARSILQDMLIVSVVYRSPQCRSTHPPLAVHSQGMTMWTITLQLRRALLSDYWLLPNNVPGLNYVLCLCL